MKLFTFGLSEEQQTKLTEWTLTKDMEAYTGAIGGRFTYSFTPTNLGTVVKVKDELDGTKIDLSDYDSW